MSTTKHEEFHDIWEDTCTACGRKRYDHGSHSAVCPGAKGTTFTAPNLAAQLEAVTAERDALLIEVAGLTASRDEWMDYCQLGGNPLYQPPDFKEPAVCRCDPQDEHEIYGTGHQQPDGSIWCELHSFRHQIAELRHLAGER